MKVTKRLFSRSLTIAAIVVCLVMALSVLLPTGSYFTANAADTDVSNNSSFSTDVIYQILTDRFYDGDPSNNPTGEIFDKNNPRKYHGGDWAGIIQKLNANYFTNMGVTALWISAPVENIMTIDPSNGCASYHGYWAKDFFRTNSAFGTKAELQTLINTAHNKGIKIVIDFAPNHTSCAEFGSMVFPEDGRLYRDGTLVGGFKNDTLGLFNHEGWTDWNTYENGVYHSMAGLADLNHQNNTVDKYLKDAVKVWLDMGVDGLRVDAVKHMSFGWQKSWMSDYYASKPVFTFGEWFAGGIGSDPQLEYFANNSGMSVLDFRFANGVRDAIGTQNITMRDFNNMIIGSSTDYAHVNDQVTFIDNHDMSRFMTVANNNSSKVDMAYVLQMTSRGIPTIYYGSEHYLTGAEDPFNRGDMPGFGTTTASNVISKLAPLRKSNPALAYGTMKEIWINDNVYVYERQFGKSVVVTAINRGTTGYNIAGALTALPNGTYSDVLQNLKGGGTLTVAGGAVSNYTLGGGQCAVWQYTAPSESSPIIGNVNPMMGKAGNTITIAGRGFGSGTGTVKFGTTAATVVSWSDTMIKVKVPTVGAGKYGITVTRSGSTVASAPYGQYNVLSGNQVSVRFKVNNAPVSMFGVNVYMVGNVPELGSWDTSKAIGPFFNATDSIAVYPNWFYDISVPAGTRLEYKFVKIDGAGNVIWESGNNHVYTSGSGNSEVTVNWQ